MDENALFAAAAGDAIMQVMLPCGDVDAITEFWAALGLKQTYRQPKPHPYVIIEAGAITLHYYGMDNWQPDTSHATCGIVVPDTQPIYDRFAAGFKQLYGKVSVTGYPHITRPRHRANNGGLSGFSVIDSAGNWIRVNRAPELKDLPKLRDNSEHDTWTSHATNYLSRALENAVVLADSRGDVSQARKILASAIDRKLNAGEEKPPVTDRAHALSFLIELAVRDNDHEMARSLLLNLEDLAPELDFDTAANIVSAVRQLFDEM